MRILPIMPYSYNNFAIKNTQVKQASNVSSMPQVGQIGGGLNAFRHVVSFNSNTPNWTDGILNGYDEQLRYLQNILIDPIKDSHAVAAPIVIVYSPDKDIANLVKSSVNEALPGVHKISANSGASFNKIITEGLKCGREHYIATGKKSLLMIDNIENYINTSDKEISRLKKDFNDIFSEKDFDAIRAQGSHIENINTLKSTADYCSNLPKRETDVNSATTIFSISDNPQIIDTELLRRPEKVYTVVFPPLHGEAFAHILKKEVQKQDYFLRNIMNLSSKAVEKVDMPYNSWKNLQKIKNSSTRNPLDLNAQKIPFDVIAEFCSPDDKYGAFLAKQIPEIVQQATYKYIENPQKEFLTYLLKELKTTKRILTPQDLNRENNIKNFVEFRQDLSLINDSKQVDKMLKAYNSGFISKQKINKLISEIVNAEINSVKKGSQEDTFANLKYKPVLDKLKSEYILSRIDKLSDNRYKFSYQDNKDDYVDLYLGSFGWKKETLWIDSPDIEKIELTRHFINEIKSLNEFKEIKIIEFPLDKRSENPAYKPAGRTTMDNKDIYYVNLDNKNKNSQGGQG